MKLLEKIVKLVEQFMGKKKGGHKPNIKSGKNRRR